MGVVSQHECAVKHNFGVSTDVVVIGGHGVVIGGHGVVMGVVMGWSWGHQTCQLI